MMRLLLLSNSVGSDGEYLSWARPYLAQFLGTTIKQVLFVPFAGVPDAPATYANSAARVRAVFEPLGHAVRSLHESTDPIQAIETASAIVVGGGNTFHLLALCYEKGVLAALSNRVRSGVPYIGWSAGSNIACPGIWTTNDMPIVAPPSLLALGLVAYQINAHFTDAHPAGHRGETRTERIAEFLAVNPERTVIGLREDALLHVENGVTTLRGTGARVFRHGQEPVDVAAGAELFRSS